MLPGDEALWHQPPLTPPPAAPRATREKQEEVAVEQVQGCLEHRQHCCQGHFIQINLQPLHCPCVDIHHRKEVQTFVPVVENVLQPNRWHSASNVEQPQVNNPADVEEEIREDLVFDQKRVGAGEGGEVGERSRRKSVHFSDNCWQFPFKLLLIDLVDLTYNGNALIRSDSWPVRSAFHHPSHPA